MNRSELREAHELMTRAENLTRRNNSLLHCYSSASIIAFFQSNFSEEEMLSIKDLAGDWLRRELAATQAKMRSMGIEL